MKLISTTDDSNTMLTQRLVSEHGLVEIGIYRVIFGWRVRAGFVGRPWCQIDWCCGNDPGQLWSHYVALTLLLRRRDETDDCFRGIPECSAVKPCFKDVEFEQRLTDLMLAVPGISEKQSILAP